MHLIKQQAQPASSRKNLEAIENYLVADEEERAGIELSPKQEELLQRWRFADNLICKDRYKPLDIVEQIAKKFSIAESSAWDDLRNAQIVFAAGNAIHKRHGMYRQIRRLEDSISKNIQSENWKTVENLEKVLQKAYDALPDAQAPKSARTIVFNIQPAAELAITESEVTDAMKLAAEMLDYEELPPEE